MNICVVGAGMQGRVVARDLCKSGHQVTAIDNNINYLRQLKKIAPSVKARQFNVTNQMKFARLLKPFDIAVGALPAALGFYLMKSAINAGVNLVDMSYLSENPLLLDEKAKKAKVKIIPDAGFAPGLSNILIGETYKEFGGFDYLKIRVGGIPQKPVPPFNYRITWSPVDLIEEYTRPSRIIKDHECVTVDALSDIETITVPKVGRLECFYTDGLRTLLSTLKNVKNMEEKTIRYPGHAQLMKTIIHCGFLSDMVVRYNKRLVNVAAINTELLRMKLNEGDDKDFSIMVIETRKGKKKKKYHCIDYYDEKQRITSMARMTAYTASIIAQCCAEYPRNGVIPPEYLGMEKHIVRFIKSELKKRHIEIT
jgi:lysine 6-dehydrogenase